MSDREKVLAKLRRMSTYFKSMMAVGWQGDKEVYQKHRETVNMAIELLKKDEQEILDFIGAVAKLTAENEMLRMVYGDQGEIVGELVRCKDCRHYLLPENESRGECMARAGWFPVDADWYCADGERRKVGEAE